jgi:hypothetical protein
MREKIFFLQAGDPANDEYRNLWTAVRTSETFDQWKALIQHSVKSVRSHLVRTQL